MRGLKVRIADSLQEWSEKLKDLNTPNSFRKYVDDLFALVKPELFMHKTGGTFTGPVFMAGDAANDLSPTTLQQVRTMIAALPHHTQTEIMNWITTEIGKIDTSGLMPKAGGTFTGDVILKGNATNNLHPVTLQQLNAAVSGIPTTDTSGLMPKSGGTFTGDIVLKANADQPLEPVTLQQMQAALQNVTVDTSGLMPKAGGTFTGDVTLKGDAATALQPTTLQQVTAMMSGVPVADLSGLMSKSGGTFTGAVTMAGDAAQPLQPTTLQQVQALLNAIDLTGLMPKSGGTFTGDIVLKANADQPLEPVTLQQMQAAIAAASGPTTYPYDINFSSGGTILPGDYLNAFIAQRQVTIPQSFTKCTAKVLLSAPKTKEDGAMFELVVDGAVVCTILFEKNATTGVFALASPGNDIVIPSGSTVAMRAHGTRFDTTISFPVITLTGTTPTN